MSTIYVYVSSLFDARSERRTGIPRLEYEIARELVGRGAKLLTFSRLLQRFVIVDFDAQIAPLVHAQDQCAGPKLNESKTGALQSVMGYAARPLLPLATAVGGPIGINIFAVASPALTAEERRRLAVRLKLFSNARASIQYSSAVSRSWRDRARSFRLPRPAEFSANDVVVVPAIILEPKPLAELSRLSCEVGVHLIAYIHDLIPIRRPEFQTDDAGVVRFRHYLATLLRHSRYLCVNSDYVADDLRSYIRETGVNEIPILKVAPCAAIDAATSHEPSPRLGALRLKDQHYVLYVSTMNPRKNHIGIYHLWRRLVELDPNIVPPLVFAGQRGWNSDDMLKQISRDGAMWNRHIHFVESPTDSEVCTLYRNCAFTVFPSQNEGWGLAISESLAFGKPCIAADNTSLREAGQGLSIHIDHLDGPAWIAELLRMIKDVAYRDNLASAIRSQYRPRTWAQFGQELFDVASNLTGGAE